MSDLSIDEMVASEWTQVRDIYLDGIASGQATFETDAPNWSKWDAEHLPYGRLVARAGATVKGWAALSAVSGRCVYAGVAETSVYVGRQFRGQGIGSALVEALVPVAESRGIWTLQASMFPENSGSIRLHQRFGFREVGRRERIGRLRGVWRDTLLFERRSTVSGVDAQNASGCFESAPPRRQLSMRLWTTRIVPGGEAEYLAFAEAQSRQMFLAQQGCLGVLFLTTESGEHAVCSFWRNRADIAALASSPRYADTVARLQATGLLLGDAKVTVYELEGGAVNDIHGAGPLALATCNAELT